MSFTAKRKNRHLVPIDKAMTALLALMLVAGWFPPPSCLAFTLHPNRSPRPGVATTTTPLRASGAEDDDDTGFDENVAAAVVVPGFLTGADEFSELCATLTARGIPTVAVPMPNWHWLPCLGGRSARPILERIDFTVQHLVANLENADNGNGDAVEAIRNIPTYRYSLLDCWQDFRNNPGGALAVGGSAKVDDYPVVEPRGEFPLPEDFRVDPDKTKKKIALIGHRYVPDEPEGMLRMLRIIPDPLDR